MQDMVNVYILKSLCDGSFYTGITKDAHNRLHEHNSGKTPSTAKKRPWVLWYIEESDSMENARKREKYFKKKNQPFKEGIRNVYDA